MAEIGPALPPGFKLSTERRSDDVDKAEDTDFGPALPPGLTSCSSTKNDRTDSPPRKKKTIGPTLPEGFLVSDNTPEDIKPQCSPSVSSGSAHIIGPILPPGFSKPTPKIDLYEDYDLIGPSLPSSSTHVMTVAEEFEERAAKMRKKLLNKDDPADKPVTRDSWMMELPPEVKPDLGLDVGPRVFRKDGGAKKRGDTSCWTDTPADMERKAQEKAEGRGPKRVAEDDDQAIISSRDQAIAVQIEEYNKSKRAKSLMDMHEKKMKKKRKKEKKEKEKERKKKKSKSNDKADKPERKPFDRESDLQVNKFDAAQRKALVQRSHELDGRFSHGGKQFL